MTEKYTRLPEPVHPSLINFEHIEEEIERAKFNRTWIITFIAGNLNFLIFCWLGFIVIVTEDDKTYCTFVMTFVVLMSFIIGVLKSKYWLFYPLAIFYSVLTVKTFALLCAEIRECFARLGFFEDKGYRGTLRKAPVYSRAEVTPSFFLEFALGPLVLCLLTFVFLFFVKNIMAFTLRLKEQTEKAKAAAGRIEKY